MDFFKLNFYYILANIKIRYNFKNIIIIKLNLI